MDYRIKRPVTEQAGIAADQAGIGDIAREHNHSLFYVMVEARFQMLAQWTHHRRVEDFAAEAIEARFAVAPNKQVEPLQLRMIAQQEVDQNFTEEACRTGNQNTALVKNFGKWGQRICWRG